MDAGYQAHLAHPSAMKKYEGLKYSGDFADAAYLAHLLRLGLLREGYIFPRELRAIRDLAREGCNWFAVERYRFYPSRIFWRGKPADEWKNAKSRQ